jgi:hypothetical protein
METLEFTDEGLAYVSETGSRHVMSFTPKVHESMVYPPGEKKTIQSWGFEPKTPTRLTAIDLERINPDALMSWRKWIKKEVSSGANKPTDVA